MIISPSDNFAISCTGTAQIEWTLSYGDSSSTNTVSPVAEQAATGRVAASGVTTLDGSPATNYTRKVLALTLLNKDASVTQTVSFGKVVAGDFFAFTAATVLAAGELLAWTEGAGFKTYTAQGIIVPGAGTIADGAVTLAKMANLAANSIIGNNTGSPATPIALTAAQTKTLLAVSLTSDVSGVLQAAQEPAHTGDVTNSAGSLALTIPAGTVTLAKQANLAANSFQGNNTGSPGVPLALTVAQAKTLLAVSLTSDVAGTLQAAQFPALTGDVTTSAGALATTIAAAAVTLAKQANLPAHTFIGNNTAGSAVPLALTIAQMQTELAVPAAANPTTATVGTAAVNGSASTFMRSDAAPPISLTMSPTWTGNHTFTASGGSASVTLGAGTTAIAPLKLTSGTNLTTAAAGAMEYDGTVAYFSPAASSRGVALAEYVEIMSGTKTLVSQTGAQAILNGTTNGAVTLPIGTYEFECFASLTALSATSGAFGFALGGTKTSTEAWWAVANKATLATPAAPQGTFNTAANVLIATATTATVGYLYIKGIIRVTVSGTVIPQISQTTAAAAVVGVNSFACFRCIGNGTAVSVGNWS